jgi:hypothetical protein
VPPPRAVARRRRTAVTISCSLVLRSPQLRLGAGSSAVSAHDNREVIVGHALSIPTVATAPRNAERSSSLRSASASSASRPPRMARRLVAGLARRRSTKVTRSRENGTSGISPPEQVLKDILTGDSDSSDDNDRQKKLYVMYGGSWELTSRRNVKSLLKGK